jgi:hypothetical protein
MIKQDKVNKFYLVFEGGMGITLYDLAQIDFRVGGGEDFLKINKFNINGIISSCSFNPDFDSLSEFYNSIFESIKLSQKEMMLNLKCQGFLEK